MKIINIKNINSNQEKEINSLFIKLNTGQVDHDISYPPNKHNSKSYFLAYKKNVLIGYTIVFERQLSRIKFIKFVKISPHVFIDGNKQEFLQKIIKYYKVNKYCFISFEQDVLQFEQDVFFLERATQAIKKSKKSTIIINFETCPEPIKSTFSKDIKKNINKSKNKEVDVSISISEIDYIIFGEIYKKMLLNKNITGLSEREIIDYCHFAEKQENSFVLKATFADVIIGFGIFITNLNKTTYIIGATDNNYKKIPCSHSIIYEAIKQSKKNNISFFDLGGIEINNLNNEQKNRINKFKKGFSNNEVRYISEYHYVFSKVKYRTYNLYLIIVNLINGLN